MTERSRALLGIDTGGTFTDFVLVSEGGEIRTLKLPSNPEAPERPILEGLRALALGDRVDLTIVHGSTVATNALLERRGTPAVLVTNEGFTDLLRIGRQTRRELYNLTPMADQRPGAEAPTFGVNCRVTADGMVERSPGNSELARLVAALKAAPPEAIAVCFLFSYLEPEHERRVAERLARAFPGVPISCSHALVGEPGEYERAVTTWCNAYLQPAVAGYLSRLREALGPTRVSIMQSAAVTVDLPEAAGAPVRMLLSGPAGGLVAARRLGAEAGAHRLLTFDMGGTSTDVGLMDGDVPITSQAELAGIPIAVPTLDMHTIGAGGGSVVFLDAAGGLQVGPQSAGAWPGPICYGRGGEMPTVTDANLVLGRIPPEYDLGGIHLDLPAAEAAFAALARRLELPGPREAAAAAIDMVNANMVAALRVMSVQRGLDPAELTLTSFGGAGGLHVCALAEAVGIREAWVPMHAGILSALGMALASPGRESAAAIGVPLSTESEPEIQALIARLAESARASVGASLPGAPTLKMHARIEARYRGQAATIAVSWSDAQAAAAAFHEAHEARFGHRLNKPVEAAVVRVRVEAPPLWDGRLPVVGCDESVGPEPVAAAGEGSAALPVFQREALPVGKRSNGPCVVRDASGTTFIAPGWSVSRDAVGHLWLHQK